jgi:hypothetical protein
MDNHLPSEGIVHRNIPLLCIMADFFIATAIFKPKAICLENASQILNNIIYSACLSRNVCILISWQYRLLVAGIAPAQCCFRGAYWFRAFPGGGYARGAVRRLALAS